MTKLELRKYYLEQRRLLSNKETIALDQSIIEQLKNSIDFSLIKYIHLFLPIKNHNEIDLWPLINLIWENNKHITIVVPKCDFKTRVMTSVELTPNTELCYDNYNIPEPITGKIISNDLIDTVITPLIICDLNGYRVGYGKGFYDNFFNSCKPTVKRFGIGYFSPIKKIEDIANWDTPLTHYISPTDTYIFE